MSAAHDDAFIDLLIATMQGAALERKLAQLKVRFDPTGTGKGTPKTVRIIVVPEDMDFNFPSHAPLGTGRG